MKKTILIILASLLASNAHAGRYLDTEEQIEVACEDLDTGDRTFVMLVAGQSNAGNSVSRQYVPRGDVYMFNSDRCFVAMDPMLGATGIAGSTWGRVADLLIDSGSYDRVVITSVAKGGSTIEEWAPSGVLFKYLAKQKRGMKMAGMEIDAVLFQQGESDAAIGTTMDVHYAYLSGFIKGLRNYTRIAAPVYVSRTSKCFGVESRQIRWSQGYAAQTIAGVIKGPNTDTLGSEMRHDNCHFNGLGSEALAQMWAEVLR